METGTISSSLPVSFSFGVLPHQIQDPIHAIQEKSDPEPVSTHHEIKNYFISPEEMKELLSILMRTPDILRNNTGNFVDILA